MRLQITDLHSLEQTGATMGRLAKEYALDAIELASLSLEELHALILSWPYKADPKGLEWVQRPKYTIDGSGPCRDCDDRAVVVGAWAELNGLPYRFVAVGTGATPHHVFAQVWVGDWITVDATYPTDRLNVPVKWGCAQVIHARRP